MDHVCFEASRKQSMLHLAYHLVVVEAAILLGFLTGKLAMELILPACQRAEGPKI